MHIISVFSTLSKTQHNLIIAVAVGGVYRIVSSPIEYARSCTKAPLDRRDGESID